MPCSPAMSLRAITPGVTLGASQELHPGISMHLTEPHVQCRFVTCNCDSVCDSVRHFRLLGLSCINRDSELTILRCAVVLQLYGGMFCALLSVVGRPVPSLALLLNNYPLSRSCCTAAAFYVHGNGDNKAQGRAGAGSRFGFRNSSVPIAHRFDFAFLLLLVIRCSGEIGVARMICSVSLTCCLMVCICDLNQPHSYCLLSDLVGACEQILTTVFKRKGCEALP